MEFKRIQTPEQAREFIKIIPEVVAIDTEYVKGDPRTTKLLSVIVGDSDRAWAIEPNLLPILKNTLESRKLVFLQDYNHCDTIILLKNGVDLRGCNTHNLIDMHHLIDENADHSLEQRTFETFHDNYKARFWSLYDSFETADETDALEYQCKDAIYTYRLGMQDIQKMVESGKDSLYQHIRQLSASLLDTELEGLPVNVKLMQDTQVSMQTQIDMYLPKLREEFNEYCTIWELKKWQEEIFKRSSERGRSNVRRPVFSFNSDAQLRELLFGEQYLSIEVKDKTKKGNASTAYDTLKGLAESYPQLQTLVEYKDLKGVYSTFVVGMLERVQDGRIYPHFNVSGTTTGRISHSDPNMGNLPKDGIIRNFFIPSSGMVIIGADYEQLEVVVELNLTEDPGLKEIVLGGASKHDLFKVELDKAGFNLPRSQVKNVNFALQYRAQARKISKMVGCDIKDAQRIIDVFHAKFSGVKKLQDETDRIIERDGQITNLAGRTRHFTKPKNIYEKYKQQRMGYNFIIQGLAAEACNRAYYRFANEAKYDSAPCRALFSVHDEIVAEAGEGRWCEYWKDRLVFIMEQSSDDFSLKYRLKAKPYGPLPFWSKT